MKRNKLYIVIFMVAIIILSIPAIYNSYLTSKTLFVVEFLLLLITEIILMRLYEIL